MEGKHNDGDMEEYCIDFKNRSFSFKSYYGAIVIMAIALCILVSIGVYYISEMHLKELHAGHKSMEKRLESIEKLATQLQVISEQKLTAHKELNEIVADSARQLARLNAIMYMRMYGKEGDSRDMPRGGDLRDYRR